MNTKRAIISVLAAERAQENQWLRDNLGVVGDTFYQGFSVSGDAPYTHFLCSWACDEATYAALMARYDGVGTRRAFEGRVTSKKTLRTGQRETAEALSTLGVRKNR